MTPRKLFDIISSESLYKKLASPAPIQGKVWLTIPELMFRVDPKEYSSSPYAKYVMAARCSRTFSILIAEKFIVEWRGMYAIHDRMIEKILEQSKAEVDAYLDQEL